MKNNLAAFILFTTASVFASVIPTDSATVFDLAAETAKLAAPARGSPDSDASFPPEFRVGRHHRCYWSGTAPFCIGYCGDGYMEMRRNKCGNGLCCWAGSKALCCRKTRGIHIYPPIPHHPHKSNPPPRKNSHAMPQLSTKKYDLSHHPEENIQNDGDNGEGLRHNWFGDFEAEFFGGSEGLPPSEDVIGDFGGSDEHELEESQGQERSEGLEHDGIEGAKEYSTLNDIKPLAEFLVHS